VGFNFGFTIWRVISKFYVGSRVKGQVVGAGIIQIGIMV
jgi:hypothetical protein